MKRNLLVMSTVVVMTMGLGACTRSTNDGPLSGSELYEREIDTWREILSAYCDLIARLDCYQDSYDECAELDTPPPGTLSGEDRCLIAVIDTYYDEFAPAIECDYRRQLAQVQCIMDITMCSANPEADLDVCLDAGEECPDSDWSQEAIEAIDACEMEE